MTIFFCFYFKNIANLTFLKCLICFIIFHYQRRLFCCIALKTFCTYRIISVRFKRCLFSFYPYFWKLGGYCVFLVRAIVSGICPSFKNSAPRPEPLLTLIRKIEVDYRSGIAAFRRREPQFLAFCEVFFPRSILPGVGGPIVMSFVVVSQKALPWGEVLCQKLEAKKKEVFIVPKTSSNFYY